MKSFRGRSSSLGIQSSSRFLEYTQSQGEDLNKFALTYKARNGHNHTWHRMDIFELKVLFAGYRAVKDQCH
jgi:hypothetical protein